MDLLYRAGGDKVTEQQLEQEIEDTRLKIFIVKAELDLIRDIKEEKRLEKELKELQIHQLWLLEQIGW